MKSKFILIFSLFICICSAQEKEYNSAIVKVSRYIEGSLVTPYSDKKSPLLIFIMDAGPINRDGNDRMSKNNTFKKLAYDLAKSGIATFRYDKRLFKMESLGIKEHEISFDHFIEDAKSVIDYFKKNEAYTKVMVVGHGQGSLIGMIAAKERADGFISIAGNADPLDEVIVEQIAKQAPGLEKNAAVAFRQLLENGRAVGYDPALESIFRYDLQPFIKSWMKYDPKQEIAALDIPILIVHGDKDIQVELSQSEKLKEASPQATYAIISNMNHILKEIKGDRLESYKSYNEAWRKIMPEVLNSIVKFVKE